MPWVRPQAAMPLGDKQQQVADVYLRTVSTMEKLRQTLRDEHSFLIKVGGTARRFGTLLVTMRLADVSSALLLPQCGHAAPAVRVLPGWVQMQCQCLGRAVCVVRLWSCQRM